MLQKIGSLGAPKQARFSPKHKVIIAFKSVWIILWLAYDVVTWQEDNLQQQQL